MKKLFKTVACLAVALTALTLQGCSELGDKNETATGIEGIWETVYFADDDAVYETKGTYGEWHQHTEEGESGPISRSDEDYMVLKFYNGTITIMAANDPDMGYAVSMGAKFPYQIKDGRITSLLFQPETTEGYFAIEDMTDDTFKLVCFEKGFYTEDLEYDEEPDRKVIHERSVTTFKRLR